jgi:hypothetical protein
MKRAARPVRPSSPRRPRLRPLLELLEDRLAPATFTGTDAASNPAADVTVTALAESAASPVGDYVHSLYRAVLHRAAEPAGLAAWVGALEAGLTRQQVAQGFWESPEHRGLQVDGFYATYLHRAADAPGRASWVSALLAGASEAEVARGFLTSAEYLQAHPDLPGFVRGLYADVLGRTPEAAELAGWVQAGHSRASIADAFLHSPEELARLVGGLYAEFLGREGEPAGVQGWVAGLQGGLSWSQAAVGFLASDEFLARAAADA